MARPAVASWVAMSYPIILVDEAQDLSSARSTMIAGVGSNPASCGLAFDEFQCLDPALRPMPIQNWLPSVCVPTSSTRCRRTNSAELLQAARAVREWRCRSTRGKTFQGSGDLRPTSRWRPIWRMRLPGGTVAWGPVAVLGHRGAAALLMPSSGWSAHVPWEINGTALLRSNGKAATKWSVTRYG